MALFYLNGETTPKFRRPGPTSRARWMAKIIYVLKIVILAMEIRKQLPVNSVFTEEQLPVLVRIANFFCIELCEVVAFMHFGISSSKERFRDGEVFVSVQNC